MRRTALWQVSDEGPKKLTGSSVRLEEELENWIENAPDLLRAGLTILERQMSVEAGAVDLLALDPEGAWIVVELKRGYVSRATVAQALDYAACVATMPYRLLEQNVNAYLAARGKDDTLRELLGARAGTEALDKDERDVDMFVVGTGRDAGLQRMVGYLSERYGLPISIVTFDVFDTESGERILVRELSEAETEVPDTRRRGTLSIEEICRQADGAGIGDAFRRILEGAKQVGVYPVPWKECIRYAPPGDRRRCLFTVWSSPVSGASKMQIYIYAEGFANSYPVTEPELAEHLGGSGWFYPSLSEVDSFLSGLSTLFARLRREQSNGSEEDPNA